MAAQPICPARCRVALAKPGQKGWVGTFTPQTPYGRDGIVGRYANRLWGAYIVALLEAAESKKATRGD